MCEAYCSSFESFSSYSVPSNRRDAHNKDHGNREQEKYDAEGNFYGTTGRGGSVPCKFAFKVVGCGVVFKLDAAGSETLLHSFSVSDGSTPEAELIFDTSGNLFGTAPAGGTYGGGVVFEIIP